VAHIGASRSHVKGGNVITYLASYRNDSAAISRGNKGKDKKEAKCKETEQKVNIAEVIATMPTPCGPPSLLLHVDFYA
jgi:hypothetical protein